MIKNGTRLQSQVCDTPIAFVPDVRVRATEKRCTSTRLETALASAGQSAAHDVGTYRRIVQVPIESFTATVRQLTALDR